MRKAPLHAFSLVELLVVMAVSSILIALAFPALKSGRDRAGAIKCQSNLRQMGVAVVLYGSDRSIYPAGNSTNGLSALSYLLSPYLDRHDGSEYSAGPNSRSPVVQCPSTSIKSTNTVCSYSAHPRICVDESTTPPRRFPMHRQMPEMVLLMDAVQDPLNLGGDSTAVAYGVAGIYLTYDETTRENAVDAGPDFDETANTGNIRWRHAGRANFLFLDGHVESLAKGDLREKNIKLSD